MKRLLLLGGGHAHLRVLDQLARSPLRGWEIVLLTPQPQALYSGMLPGWVAGHYRLDQCAIDVVAPAGAAGVRLLVDEAQALDTGQRSARSARHDAIAWDVLSIDVGSACAHAGIDGANEHAIPIRPLPGFVQSWQRLVKQMHAGGDPLHLVIVGAGAGGVELALGARHRALREGWERLNVHLVGSGDSPLPAAPARVQARLLERMREQGIRWHAGQGARVIRSDAVQLTGGEVLRSDICWLVTGPAAHPWLAGCGLELDGDGYVKVGATLQSLTDPDVFAAGDAASHPAPVPRSGVYAVRSGTALASNLLAHCRGERLLPWQPQPRALYLLSTADRHAIGLWGRLHWESRWLWVLKDAIDRRFVRAHSR